MPVEDVFSKGRAITETGQDVDAFKAPDINAEEYADHTARLVANALEATQMFTVVEIQSGVGQVHILGRVKREREREFSEQVVYPILLTMKKDSDCNGFVGRQYLLKDGESLDHMRYAWVVSFASNDLRSAAFKICESFRPVTPRAEVTEGPLLGPPPPQSGGRSSGKKGAAPLMG